MREILFRGKRIDNGEWVYGYYICKQDPLLPGIDTNVIVTFDENSMSVWNKVAPSTIGQYTGLTDKNGVKIFEGDILKWDEREWGEPHFEVVTWGYDLLAMRAKDWSEFCIVLGNIHDNPGLLKEASNAPTN